MSYTQQTPKRSAFSHLRIGLAVLLVLLAIGSLVSIEKLVEDVGASDYVVIKSPIAGDLKWFTQPGLAWQGFGDVTIYNIRMKYDFSEKGYNVQFNDGGHGTIYGSIQCDLSPDTTLLTAMHRKFGSQDQVEASLIKTAVDGALYLVGPLMSSRESYAEKKNDLIHYVTDQVLGGPYRTKQVRTYVKDPISNETKEVIAAEILIDPKTGQAERQEKSALSSYGINCYQFTIRRIQYDDTIAKQIMQQQQITMDVQTSIAEKVKAEQRAQTAEASGRANATEAKWRQETIKAQVVTQAEQEKLVQITNAERDKAVAETQANQRLTVADLDRRSAEQKKQEDILIGEGQAAKKKLIIEADGALEQKLAAYVQVTPKIFEALRGTAFVPQFVMGGGAAGQGNTAADLINLLTAKTAKDLSLDLSLPTRK